MGAVEIRKTLLDRQQIDQCLGADRLDENPELAQVPRLVEFAKNDDDRDLLAFLSNLGVVARAVAFGPGVPADRTAALRHAFDAVMKDPAVLAEGEKEHLDISPMTGDQTLNVITNIVGAKSSTIERAKTLLNN